VEKAPIRVSEVISQLERISIRVSRLAAVRYQFVSRSLRLLGFLAAPFPQNSHSRDPAENGYCLFSGIAFSEIP